MDERAKKKLPKEDDSDEDKENEQDNLEGQAGVSKAKFIEVGEEGE
jgi:hypothetical protein